MAPIFPTFWWKQTFFGIKRGDPPGAAGKFTEITIAIGRDMEYSIKCCSPGPFPASKKWLGSFVKCWIKSTKINLTNVLQ